MKSTIKQLNNLKSIKPENAWKEKNREILFSQIGNIDTGETFTWTKTFAQYIQELPLMIAKKATQPVMAVILIVLFTLGSGAMSIKAAQDTKPGDSLYIAKIISEKAQIAFTFNEKEKAQLNLEFAGNRAEELSQVLEETDSKEKEKNVKKLVNNFNKEIDSVKLRIKKIAQTNDQEKEIIDNLEEDLTVFSANVGKEENGLQITSPKKDDEKEVEDKIIQIIEPISPTTTPILEDSIGSTTEDNIVFTIGDPQKILDQARLLLENNDYNGTIDKLNEAGDAITQTNSGEVKGEYEEASSTEEIIDEGEVLGVEEKAPDSEETDLNNITE